MRNRTFGMSVVMAVWIGAMAGAGQILTSQIVYDLLSGAGQFKFDSVGEHTLRASLKRKNFMRSIGDKNDDK